MQRSREERMSNPFKDQRAKIAENDRLRAPQREAHAALQKLLADGDEDREVGIVLPVGCGKSGCIALAPFCFSSEASLGRCPRCRHRTSTGPELLRAGSAQLF